MSREIGLLELGLVRKQCVVKLPELPLLARAAGRFRCGLRLRVDFSQREIHKGELHAAGIFGEDVFQGGLRVLAVRALKIRKLDQRDSCL